MLLRRFVRPTMAIERMGSIRDRRRYGRVWNRPAFDRRVSVETHWSYAKRLTYSGVTFSRMKGNYATHVCFIHDNHSISCCFHFLHFNYFLHNMIDITRDACLVSFSFRHRWSWFDSFYWFCFFRMPFRVIRPDVNTWLRQIWCADSNQRNTLSMINPAKYFSIAWNPALNSCITWNWLLIQRKKWLVNFKRASSLFFTRENSIW